VAEPDRLIGVYPVPRVLRLVSYVVTRWRYGHGGPARSRGGVLTRDGHRCAYCGGAGATTVDHVLPRSRGGRDSWKNTVAAGCYRQPPEGRPHPRRSRDGAAGSSRGSRVWGQLALR